jgi:hypothetical protein
MKKFNPHKSRRSMPSTQLVGHLERTATFGVERFDVLVENGKTAGAADLEAGSAPI